jgi:putative NADPH-quinone reductase
MSSRFLIIISHPDANGESTSHRLAKAAEDSLRGAGHEVKIVDLIKTAYNEGGSVKDFIKLNEGRFDYSANAIDGNLIPATIEQQELLIWCTHVIFIGPIWYYRFPASLYAWIERVFTIGFGCDFKKKLEDMPLYGRKALFVATTGAPEEFYVHGGPRSSLDGILYSTTIELIYTGMKVFRSQGIFGMGVFPPETIASVIEQFGKAILKIDKRPVLPFMDPNKPEGVDDIEVFARFPNISLEEALSL